MTSCLLAASGLFVLAASGALATVMGPCDLADALEKLGAPKEQISTWVCIARFESDYNTSAVGPPNWDGSRDHGIFQINDRYWCSPPGSACGVDCRSLENDDIADDWRCVKRIYKAHKLQQGDGFQAWAVYGAHCSGDTSSYTAACSKSPSLATIKQSSHAHQSHSAYHVAWGSYGIPALSFSHPTSWYNLPAMSSPIRFY